MRPGFASPRTTGGGLAKSDRYATRIRPTSHDRRRFGAFCPPLLGLSRAAPDFRGPAPPDRAAGGLRGPTCAALAGLSRPAREAPLERPSPVFFAYKRPTPPPTCPATFPRAL